MPDLEPSGHVREVVVLVHDVVLAVHYARARGLTLQTCRRQVTACALEVRQESCAVEIMLRSSGTNSKRRAF